MAILIWDKIDFYVKNIKPETSTLYKDKSVNLPRRYMCIYVYIYIYIYICIKIRALKYKKQTLIELKEEMGRSTVTVANFNTPL